MNIMRHDEEFAKQNFDNYLQSKLVENIKWQDGDQNVSPDFYLSANGHEFIVEVTIIMEQVNLPNGNRPIESIYKAAENLVEEIKEELIANKILHGTYYINFPPVALNFHEKKKQIKKKIINVIREMQKDVTSQVEIEVDGIVYVSICKTKDNENEINVGMYPSSSKLEIEGFNEACDLLEERVKDKTKRLAHLPKDKILLLFSQYPFINPETYRSCVAQIPEIMGFHSVFIIHSRNDFPNYMLYSRNSAWT